MGLFNKKPKQVDRYLLGENLSKMGYHFDAFNLEELNEAEISIDDEVAGVIKTVGGIYKDNNGFFDYVFISDYKDGTKAINLNKSGIGERDLKNVVDYLFRHLEKDEIFRREFNALDLQNIREDYRELPLRSWEADDFSIKFHHLIKQEFMLLSIKSKKPIL